jgi:hypothetical protein
MPFKLKISGVLQIFKKRKEEKIIWSTPDKNECRRGKNIWSTPDFKKFIEEKNIWCTPDHRSGVNILPSQGRQSL